MPNVWAHIQFGREVLSALGMEGALDDRRWKTAFQLGCQGPDFLFYDRFLPWQSASALNRLGTLMHNERCGPFLLSLLGRSASRPLSDPASGYAIGFLLHHVLDRHLHPFVFSRSGFKKWHHQRFETAMDAVVMFRRAGIRTGRTPVAPELDTDGRLPGSEDFVAAAAEHYPALAAAMTAEGLNAAVAQMIRAQRLFFDPSGWKGIALFGRIAPFSPPRCLPEWDVLNDARLPWIDPTDRTIVREESSDELWDRALADAGETTRAALDWLDCGYGKEAARLRTKFAGLLRDVSYETGLPCGAAVITFADSVVPDL
ncbi:zinc dependent phospholipase C family protein [Cohnella suwonensis]|uniref:Zinc dependent phospholipase C family protein n=1 Tax=Cohnella suwonensis TaxID=696072 RepID=A0ABW0LUJ3_9BACL